MNEAVGMKHILEISGGGKLLVCPFRSQDLWKFIGCNLSEVTYGNN